MAQRFFGDIHTFISNRNFCFYFIFFSTLLNFGICLYEDQIGKFDWRQSYLGKVKFASFDTLSITQKVLVATEENVIAALSMKSGNILWRKVMEQGPTGTIHAFNTASNSLVSVSGGVPAVVRNWNLATGNLLNEWTIAEPNLERFEDVKWYIKDNTLHHIIPIFNSGVEITSYDCKTGEKLKTKKVSAPFVSQETKCLLAATYYVCLKGDNNLAILFFVNLFDQQPESQSITINNIFGAGVQGPYHIELVPGTADIITISIDNKRRKRMVFLNEIPTPILQDIDSQSSLYTTLLANKKVILESSYKDKVTQVILSEYGSPQEVQPQTLVSIMHDSLYKPAILASDCSSKQLREKMCKFLLLSEDYSLSLLRQNKVSWTREESLANIVAADIIELPISDQEQSIETEFDQKERDIVSMFIRRISSQGNQIKTYLQTIVGTPPQQSNQRADLVRDKFGLHKMIVAVTRAGKIFGIETRKGEIIWQLRVPNIETFMGINNMILYVQRGSRNFPHPPQCSLLAVDKETKNGVIFTFNPISGYILGGLKILNYKIKQSLLLHTTTDTSLHSILILDDKDKIHVFPESAHSTVLPVSKSTYLFTVDRTTGIVTGYSLKHSTSQNLIVDKVWEMVFSPKTQQITHVATKNPIEHVHSQGRVLGDRSVLYKYINPNLIAIVTQGIIGPQKNTLNLYLLDTVSGVIVFSNVHKRAKGPVQIVHSENWLVYSYFNEKSRRTEVATLELYEGKVQSNNTAFSSLMSMKLPIVERQAYIFPASIDALEETITEKGITSKHILVALANGGILELPWMLLDPRRPINPEIREEGVIPYMPELPIHMDAIINYNQSVSRISHIHTSPSGLESTCLVFVHGLDLFYTQVSPSKTFDVLKEDFDYYLIVIVLAVLIISSYVTKKLASQKMQKQAWK